jgi:hypothetical protein
MSVRHDQPLPAARLVLLGLALVFLRRRRLLLFVEVAIGLRGDVESELARVHRGLTAGRRYLDVVQGHDAGQRSDAARETAHLVISARQADADRQLGVEVFLDLSLRLEQLLLEARPEAGLRDVDQQVRHFGLVRQLPQHRAEGFFHFGELDAVGIQVRGTPGLGGQRFQQLAFRRPCLEQQRPLALPDQEVVTAGGGDEEQQHRRADADAERPAARIVRVEVAQLFEQSLQLVHLAAAFFLALPVGASTRSSSAEAWRR